MAKIKVAGIVRLPGVKFNVFWMPRFELVGPFDDKTYTTFLAMDGELVVGVLVVQERQWKKGIDSYGTIVRESYRGNGLATLLWVAAIEHFKPKRIHVNVVSDKGMTLISAMRETYTGIKWDVEDAGDRPLRDLRKTRKKK